MVDQDIEIIEMLCQEENAPMDPVTESEVTSALKHLNNNKAVDIMGLTCEHFKMDGTELPEFIACFLNYMSCMKTVSIVLKVGILHPVFKKGDPGNYRGITATQVLLKILDMADPIKNTKKIYSWLLFAECGIHYIRVYSGSCISP